MLLPHRATHGDLFFQTKLMLYFSALWLLLSQFNIRFNGKYSLPQATPSSHMPLLLQLLVTNLYKHNPNDVWKNHKIGKS